MLNLKLNSKTMKTVGMGLLVLVLALLVLHYSGVCTAPMLEGYTNSEEEEEGQARRGGRRGGRGGGSSEEKSEEEKSEEEQRGPSGQRGPIGPRGPRGPPPSEETESFQNQNVAESRAVYDQQKSAEMCYPKDQVKPDELMPQQASLWAEMHPDGEGTLMDRNMLQAGHLVGIDTVGQSLRNPNYGLRSEPPNPQVAVSPWMQSTMDPDINRKPMEIGGCD